MNIATSIIIAVLGAVSWFGLGIFADLLKLPSGHPSGQSAYWVFRIASWASAILAVYAVAKFVELCYNYFVG